MKKILLITIIIVAVLVTILVFKGRDYKAPVNNETDDIVNSEAKPIIKTRNNSDMGTYLIGGSNGLTLYVFGEDPDGQSSCTGQCAEVWPPFEYDFVDLTDTKNNLYKSLNVIERNDGTLQYSWGNKPLYYYSGDSVPGDFNGHGKKDGLWSVAPVR